MTPQPPDDTPTPRTDVAIEKSEFQNRTVMLITLARTLERDLTAALAQVEEWEKRYNIAISVDEKAFLEVRAELDTLRRERDEARQLIYMPGDWKCDKCGFQQHNRILNPSSGDVGAPRIEEVQVCPNDGEAMRRITWKEGSESNYDGAMVFLNERDEARRQLAEERARLDWLEEHWRDFLTLSETWVSLEGLREAINAARKGQQ